MNLQFSNCVTEHLVCMEEEESRYIIFLFLRNPVDLLPLFIKASHWAPLQARYTQDSVFLSCTSEVDYNITVFFCTAKSSTEIFSQNFVSVFVCIIRKPRPVCVHFLICHQWQYSAKFTIMTFLVILRNCLYSWGLFDRTSSSWNDVKCQLDATR